MSFNCKYAKRKNHTEDYTCSKNNNELCLMLIPDLKICSEMFLVDNNPFNNHPKFKELSDWIIIDNFCAIRIIKGGKIENIQDRVAFIEKTPRVRISKDKYGVETGKGNSCVCQERDAWLQGFKGSSDYGRDVDSRKWCDDMLILLGWE